MESLPSKPIFGFSLNEVCVESFQKETRQSFTSRLLHSLRRRKSNKKERPTSCRAQPLTERLSVFKRFLARVTRQATKRRNSYKTNGTETIDVFSAYISTLFAFLDDYEDSSSTGSEFDHEAIFNVPDTVYCEKDNEVLHYQVQQEERSHIDVCATWL